MAVFGCDGLITRTGEYLHSPLAEMRLPERNERDDGLAAEEEAGNAATAFIRYPAAAIGTIIG